MAWNGSDVPRVLSGEWGVFFTSKKLREYVGMSTHLDGSKPKRRKSRLIFWDEQIIPSMTVPIGLRSNWFSQGCWSRSISNIAAALCTVSKFYGGLVWYKNSRSSTAYCSPIHHFFCVMALTQANNHPGRMDIEHWKLLGGWKTIVTRMENINYPPVIKHGQWRIPKLIQFI